MKKLLSILLAGMILLSLCVSAAAEETSGVIKISVPEMLVYDYTSEYRSDFRYDIVVYDWLQYSEIILTIRYNEELLVPVYKHYPAIAGVYMPPVSDSVDNGTRICKIKPTELEGYPAEKDFSYDIRFGVYGTGLHGLSIEVEAYDLDGNKTDIDLQIDNEIYPEILSAEAAEKKIEIDVGHMYFNENESNNEVWLEVLIHGEHVDIDKFVIHFSADKDVLQSADMYMGSPTLDYKYSWNNTDAGFDLVLQAYNTDDYTDLLHRTGFKILKTGTHGLSATAEVIHKDGTSETLPVVFKSLRKEVIDENTVEYVYINKANLNMHPSVMSAYVNVGTKVGELLAAADTKNAVVMLRDGTILDNDDVIPNDAFIVTMFDGDKIDSIGLQLFFDIDGDSKVTAADARLALRAAAKFEKLNTIQSYAADVDGREGITAADARLILRKAAKID